MSKVNRMWYLLVFCTLVLVAGGAFAELLPTPRSAAVALYGDALATAGGKLVGRGVNVNGSRPATVSIPCGGAAEIVWREVRRETDDDGASHVFYRQYVLGGGFDAELSGSEIAVHRLANGKLYAIGGRQFESVTMEGCAKLSATQAAAEARRRVRMSRSEQEVAPGDARPGMRALFASRLDDTRLKLVQIGETFRPAWFTIGDDTEGEPHAVVLDAENQHSALHASGESGQQLHAESRQSGDRVRHSRAAGTDELAHDRGKCGVACQHHRQRELHA
ncbi:MAG TPA: hypothetical protein VI670_08455 [Thermoanaerobaculia bacterium]